MPRKANRELRSLGVSIRQGRNELGISQEDFAELCGVHRTYIGQVERGEKNVSFINILKISAALRVKPSELFGSAKL